MRFVYFTKTLQTLDTPALVQFLRDAGLGGLDVAVRPGYPVTPANAREALPKLAAELKAAGLSLEILALATDLIDAAQPEAIAVFEAAAVARVPYIKVGYFRFGGHYEADVAAARKGVAAWAKLAERTGVRACLHTHSGAYLGNNGAGMRAVLEGADPHHVVAYADTGHLAINGGPFGMELDILKPWLGLIAIKDMVLDKAGDVIKSRVVPAGQGVANWKEIAAALKRAKYTGTISLHGEYEAADLAERVKLAKEELAFLKGRGIGP